MASLTGRSQPPARERNIKGGAPSTPAIRVHVGDLLFRFASQVAAVLVLVLAVLLVIVLIWQSWLAIRTMGVRFFTQTIWDPEPSHRIFGCLAFAYGTVVTS